MSRLGPPRSCRKSCRTWSDSGSGASATSAWKGRSRTLTPASRSSRTAAPVRPPGGSRRSSRSLRNPQLRQGITSLIFYTEFTDGSRLVTSNTAQRSIQPIRRNRPGIHVVPLGSGSRAAVRDPRRVRRPICRRWHPGRADDLRPGRLSPDVTQRRGRQVRRVGLLPTRRGERPLSPDLAGGLPDDLEAPLAREADATSSA